MRFMSQTEWTQKTGTSMFPALLTNFHQKEQGTASWFMFMLSSFLKNPRHFLQGNFQEVFSQLKKVTHKELVFNILPGKKAKTVQSVAASTL